MLLVFMAPFAMKADEIIIGEGTGSDYNTPFNNYYTRSWNETIYPSSAFDVTCTINSVAYHCASTDTYTATKVNIYMGISQKQAFETFTEWTPMEELTLVYEGTNIPMGDEEWETFVLDTPFNYDGSGNLIVVVAKSSETWTPFLKYYNTESADGSYVTMYRQGDFYDLFMEHPGTAAGTRMTCAANIKLGITPDIPGAVTVIPSIIELGARPNGAWMRPASFELAATTSYSNLTVLESTNSFFVLPEYDLPITILNGEPMTVEVTTTAQFSQPKSAPFFK